MKISCILLLAISSTLLPSMAFAGKKEVEAASMVERARQLSDIRAEGSPPFRLTLNFKVTIDGGTSLEGTYKEIWASRDKWRRETSIGDLRRIEVSADQQRWLLESTTQISEPARNLPSLTAVSRLQPGIWLPDKIENRKVGEVVLRCIKAAPEVPVISMLGNTRNNGHEDKSPVVCFDPNGGAVAAEIDPRAGTSCLFSNYQKFGEREFARSYQCAKDGRTILDGRIVELVVDASPDPASFTLAGGIKEKTNCADTVRPPMPVYQPTPSLSRGCCNHNNDRHRWSTSRLVDSIFPQPRPRSSCIRSRAPMEI